MSVTPGRACPVGYRHGASALAEAPEQQADILYVIGGLYGNRPALAAIEALAAQEPGPVRFCFNGDFNWFNVDDDGFGAINLSVLQYDATLGNIEAELLTPGETADCGCAYPEQVDAGTVERSNRIHARLKETAKRHPHILARLAALPMVRRYRVGDCVVGVVHGDAESLAGWRFDPSSLDDAMDNAAQHAWIAAAFAQARVDLFASTHTCLPALRRFTVDAKTRLVINNGAAGMPNFRGSRAGLISRIGRQPAPFGTVHGETLNGVHVDAVAVHYDHARFEQEFLDNWPPGSAAHLSYHDRIVNGPDHAEQRAYPRRIA
jgi:hypothetical protein